MKTATCFFAITLLFSSPALAQDAGDGGEALASEQPSSEAASDAALQEEINAREVGTETAPGEPSTVDAEASTATTGTLSPWRIAFAPRVGGVFPTSELGPFVLVGLEVDGFLPVLNDQLVVALDASYTRPGHGGSVTDARVGGEQSYDIDTQQLKTALDVVYRFFGQDAKLIPYAGLGGLLLMQKSSEEASFIPGDHTEQSTNFGFEVIGGVDYRLGPGFLVGDVRFGWADLSQDLTGDTNAGQVSVSVGYRWGFAI